MCPVRGEPAAGQGAPLLASLPHRHHRSAPLVRATVLARARWISAATVGRPTVRVGLLGCGNVGSALARILLTNAKRIGERTGVQLELVKVAVRSATKERDVPGVELLVTTDAHEVVGDPAIDVVVEVMGGISPARDLVLQALRSGKPVVSANKELLANHGGELWDAASAAGVDLLFEASVAGGIPLIRALRESLAGNESTGSWASSTGRPTTS